MHDVRPLGSRVHCFFHTCRLEDPSAQLLSHANHHDWIGVNLFPDAPCIQYLPTMWIEFMLYM